MIDRALGWYSESPPMLWAVAQTELRRQNLEGVYQSLLRLEQMVRRGEYEREWTFDTRIIGEGLWQFLAQVAESLGHEDVAQRNRDRYLRT